MQAAGTNGHRAACRPGDCNAATSRRMDLRQLIQHYRLIGRDFEEVMRGRNESLDVYPNRPAALNVPASGF